MSEPDLPDGYILVCDSEPRMASWIATVLRAAGYRVEAFSDFDSAWERMRQEAPMVAIVGDLIGDKDTWNLLRQVRNDPVLESLACIAILVNVPEWDGLVYGRSFDMYLRKPFQPLDILLFVDRLLAGSGWQPHNRLRAAVAEARRRWRMEHDGVVG